MSDERPRRADVGQLRHQPLLLLDAQQAHVCCRVAVGRACGRRLVRPVLARVEHAQIDEALEAPPANEAQRGSLRKGRNPQRLRIEYA
jgi:hypothetical protein